MSDRFGWIEGLERDIAISFPSSIVNSILTTIAMFNSPNKRAEDITKLEETLSNIQGELLIAEEQQAHDQELQCQLLMLSDVLYDAEDMIDELRCGAARTLEVKVSNFVESIFPTSKIQKTRKKIGEIASAIKKRCDQNRDHIRRVDTVIDHNFGSTSQVLGRDDDKMRIFNFLLDRNETVSVLQIVGGVGIGKTTLARLVYNDKMMDEHFKRKLWVRAPAIFELNSLMREIYIAATGKNDYAKLTSKQLFRFCSETLEPKFLLVLDNLLSENEEVEENWSYFQSLLKNPGNGGKVVVTSKRTAQIQGAVDSLVLNVLSDDDCVTLFEKLAFTDGANNRDPQLTQIGEVIVRNCGGVPLAVKTLGSLLHQNINPLDWALISDEEIWGQDRERDSVISALKLSYAYLPSHLRRCFAYCSLFPKGYYFNSEYLIHNWMAQGFLATGHQNEEWEDVGMRYLKILFSRCFFQDVEDNGYYFTFKMQEPIHDFVQKVVKREYQRINLGVSYDDISARHLLFIGNVSYDQQLPHISANLRTIIMLGGEPFITALASKHKYLRLLCLSGLEFLALPDSIGELKHLRFLELSWNSIIQELPEAICKLQSLQILRLIGCSNLGNLPQGMQTSLPLCITSLSQLEKLVVYNCPKLNLRMDSQGQGGNAQMNLKVFTIYDLQVLADLPQLILQGSAHTLKYMRIDTCPSLQVLPAWLTTLTSLKKLEIASCPALSSLPKGMGNLTALRELRIQNSPTLSASCRNNRRNIPPATEILLSP